MDSQARKSPQTLFRIAGIAATVLSALGVAAIMGCTPSENVAGPPPPVAAQPEAPSAPAGPTQAQVDARARTQALASQAQAAQAQAAQAQLQADAQARAQVDAEAKAQAEARARAQGRAQGRSEGRAQERAQDRRADNTPDRGRCRDCGVIESVREVERPAKSSRSYEITIRFYDGSRRLIREARAPEWRTGDRVRVVNGVIRSNA